MAEALAVVERYFAAFGAGDVEGAVACVHPDAVWHVDGSAALVTAGISRGRDAVRDWLLRFPSGFRPLAFGVERMIEAEPDVIALGRFRHVVRATGAVVDSDYAIRLTVRDGLIARYQIFEDSLLLSRAHESSSPARAGRLNGTDYGWDDRGEGPAVVFLHGLFLDRGFWSATIDALAATRRCVAFDMPGHGASGWRDGLDLDGIAEDVALWMAEHGAAGATLVGHSQGGMVAMRVAARRPELVGSLVLVNTSARAEYPDRLPAWRARRAALLGDETARAAVMAEVQKLKVTPAWLDRHPDEAAAERIAMMRHEPHLLACAVDAAVIERPDCRDQLGRIRVPTTVLAGGEDRATPPELGQEIARLISGATFRLVERAAHHIPIDATSGLLDAISAPR